METTLASSLFSEISKTPFNILNDSPELLSLLYDQDLLPEQVLRNPAALRAVCLIAALYKLYMDTKDSSGIPEVEKLENESI
jgi:hypothetical protein